MPKAITYPKQPFIGVDCSGQPNAPPMIAVATRWSRRDKQNRWIVQVDANQINKHSSTPDWQEKIYASIVFRAADKILEPNYEIQIDKDFPSSKTERKVKQHLKYLFGCHHGGDPTKENPPISFKTRRSSQYVKEAHKKHGLAKENKMTIDEKTNVDYLMKLLK
jgi:hypothetical protein